MVQNNIHNFPWLEFASVKETTSTNDEVLRFVSNKEMVVVATDFQKQGRGQRGNSWESEPGQNLLFSVLIRPDYVAANEQFLLSQAVSLAIQQTLSKLLKTDEVRIKWPNDIYWRDKKLCGILIENSLFGSQIERSILGVGINLNQQVFRSDAPNPVSLQQITGESFERLPVLMQILEQFHHYLDLLKRGWRDAIVQPYFDNLYRKDGFYPYRDASGEFEARIADVEPMGHLVLVDRNRCARRYAFKEVEYVLK